MRRHNCDLEPCCQNATLQASGVGHNFSCTFGLPRQCRQPQADLSQLWIICKKGFVSLLRAYAPDDRLKSHVNLCSTAVPEKQQLLHSSKMPTQNHLKKTSCSRGNIRKLAPCDNYQMFAQNLSEGGRKQHTAPWPAQPLRHLKKRTLLSHK